MKPRLATSISVIGVLAAGGVALALNSTVLDGSSSVAVGTPALVANATPTSATAQSGSGAVDGQSSDAGGSARAASTITFAIGTAGSVVVDSVSGAVLDVIANTGWTVEPARVDATGTSKVHFIKGTQRVEALVTMVNGTPNVAVVNDTGSQTPVVTVPVNPTPIVTTPVQRPRHDDDDDHEDFEHEEDDD